MSALSSHRWKRLRRCLSRREYLINAALRNAGAFGNLRRADAGERQRDDALCSHVALKRGEAGYVVPIAAFVAPGLLVNGVEVLTRDLQVSGDGIEQAGEEIH
jgi:hypothetical protein